ncbi:hypothetical protein Q5P01_014607 [Channa striata]|uniref:Uncharacterized protein n=1 Tax=Channa striata TaxID=64152 RepID=A0AA88SFD7_CHASR|nr:hypothetical protein Q5P01_014607 [Channa striata]
MHKLSATELASAMPVKCLAIQGHAFVACPPVLSCPPPCSGLTCGPSVLHSKRLVLPMGCEEEMMASEQKRSLKSKEPPLTTHSFSPPLYLCHRPCSDTSPAPETPEGRSPGLPTLPSKKPREGVVPPGTGKPFILGASLLTDSCVDWKVGCMLHELRLHQPCGLSVPDLPSLR